MAECWVSPGQVLSGFCQVSATFTCCCVVVGNAVVVVVLILVVAGTGFGLVYLCGYV